VSLIHSAALPWLFTGLGLVLLLAWAARRCRLAHGADWGRPWLNRLDGLNRIFCHRFHRLQGTLESLPAEGPVLVVANHLSGLDPLLLIAASPRPLRFIIATEQYRRFGLSWLFRAVGCIPVDRKGRPERAFREALRALVAGEVVALFPHGTIHLDSDPHRPLKAGVARMAQLSGAPVVSVRIDGVRGQGLEMSALFLRSRARIRGYPAITCAELPPRDCLHRIAERIEVSQ